MTLPPALQAGTYKRGDIIGLGKTANENYPYCVIKVDTWVCVQYPSVDSKGNPIQMLTVPTSGEADFYWPNWHPGVDYTSPNNKPWVSWKVCYNGFYYEPSMWLTSSQTGIPPSSAEAKVGDRLNADYQQQYDTTKPKVCTNQSHPIRAWILLGSLEDDNGWNGVFTTYMDPDPISGDRRRLYFPFSFVETVADFTKIGGDSGDGQYDEVYYPQLDAPFVYEADSGRKTPSYEEPGGTYVKIKGYSATPEEQDPHSWDIITGKMSSQDIMCSSGYNLGSFQYFIWSMGISMNLWQQKVIFHDNRKKHKVPAGDGGNSVYYRRLNLDSVSSTPMPEDKTMFIDYTPGPSMGIPADYFFVYTMSRGDRANLPQGENGGSSTETFDLFFQTNHPVTFTRKFNYWLYNYKYVATSKRVAIPGSDPPSYHTVLNDITMQYQYEKKNFTSSFDQLHVYGVDKDGKTYTSKESHRVGTYVERSYYSWTEFSNTLEQSGLRYSYANWDPD
jgi:hypothetical protein